MGQVAINGGAGGLRVAGKRDVVNAKSFNVPVIGLTKPDKLPENWRSVVYITPTLEKVKELIDAGADIIAFDGTLRERPDGSNLKEIIDLIKTGSLDAWLDCLDFAPEGVLQIIKDAAVELPLNDVQKRDAIKEKLGFDVSAAIANNKELSQETQQALSNYLSNIDWSDMTQAINAMDYM